MKMTSKKVTVCRFMSEFEFNAYQRGEELVNHTDWGKTRNHSNSYGFCFFPAGPNNESPEDRLEYASGVLYPISNRICCIFRTSEPMRIEQGKYRNVQAMKKPILSGKASFWEIPYMFRDEYSIEKYSDKTFHLINFGSVDYAQKKISWGKIEKPTKDDYTMEAILMMMSPIEKNPAEELRRAALFLKIMGG